jgi:hypothetical protein
MTREELKVRAGATILDDVIESLWLSRMLAFSLPEKVDLPSARRESTHLSPCSEQNQLGDVSEVESNAASIWPPVLSRLVPD